MACEKHSAGEQPQLLDPRSGCDAEAVISVSYTHLFKICACDIVQSDTALAALGGGCYMIRVKKREIKID